jgi:hypothetical protein
MLACQALAICWYATTGYHPADTQARRLNAPRYTSKAEPSTADMTAKLRRVIIAAKFKPVRPDQPEPAEIHAIRLGRRRKPCRLNHESRDTSGLGGTGAVSSG